MKQKHSLLCTHWASKKENVPFEEYQVLSIYGLKAIFSSAQITRVIVMTKIVRKSFNDFKHHFIYPPYSWSSAIVLENSSTRL